MMPKDYEIGYGKPPKHTQFQKGRSGNPSGRRKRRLSYAELIERELDRMIAITEDGKTIRVPMRKVVARRMVNMAAKGDLRAVKQILSVCPPADETPLGDDRVVRFTLKLEDDED